jgi:hypothetical protein
MYSCDDMCVNEGSMAEIAEIAGMIAHERMYEVNACRLNVQIE